MSDCAENKCEGCEYRDECKGADDSEPVVNVIDLARLEELLDTVNGICRRNGWPFVSAVVAKIDGGMSIGTRSFVHRDHVSGIFAGMPLGKGIPKVIALKQMVECSQVLGAD